MKVRMLTAEKLAAKLKGAATPSTDPRLVGVTCLATALMLMQFGAHGERQLRQLADDHNPDRISDMSMLWEDWAKEYGYLIESVNPLIGWADSPITEDHEAVRRCFAVLSKLDITLTLRANWGELLAPVFLFMSDDDDKVALNRIYQHMDTMVAEAAATAVPERGAIGHVNAGAGGREIGIMFDMRRRGQDPTTVAFVLTEEDPLVAALCVINMAIYGAERLVMGVIGDPDQALGFVLASKRYAGELHGLWLTNTAKSLEHFIERDSIEPALADELRKDLEASGGAIEISLSERQLDISALGIEDADGERMTSVMVMGMPSPAHHEYREPGAGPKGDVPKPPNAKQKRASKTLDLSLEGEAS